MDGYLRIGFGDDVEYLRNGLNRLDELLSNVVRLTPDANDTVRLKPHTTAAGGVRP